MSLQILRPVTIKAKVTEGLKDRLAAEISEATAMLDDELKQLETQVQRAQLTANYGPQQMMQLRQLVEAEKAKRADKKAQLQEETRAIMGLPIGSEIVQGTAQSITTIDIGSDYDALMGVEVVVQDGKVIEIRKVEG